MTIRDQYVHKLKQQLDRWNADIALWEARAKAAQAGLRIDYEEHLAELRLRRDDARRRLDELAAASSDAWSDLKTGVDEAWVHLRGAVERAGRRFR